MEKWFVILKDIYFWAKVVGGLAVWYLLSRIISGILLSGGEEPLVSVKRGPKLALLITVLASPIITWLVWKDMDSAMLITALIFLIPVLLMCILFSMEPTLDR